MTILSTIQECVLDVESLVFGNGCGRVLCTVHDVKAIWAAGSARLGTARDNMENRASTWNNEETLVSDLVGKPL
jgi:hypothetical protein